MVNDSDSYRKREFHNWAKPLVRMRSKKDTLSISDVLVSAAGTRGVMILFSHMEGYAETYIFRESLSAYEESKALSLLRTKYNPELLKGNLPHIDVREINKELQKYVLPSVNTINV